MRVLENGASGAGCTAKRAATGGARRTTVPGNVADAGTVAGPDCRADSSGTYGIGINASARSRRAARGGGRAAPSADRVDAQAFASRPG